MASKTFYLDKATGAVMICDADASYSYSSILANPFSNLDKISFHTGLPFIRIQGEISVASVSFSAVARDSQSWSSSGCGCFITTACCSVMGLPDDCEELETLRAFRDQFMMSTAKGRQLVQTYYDTAPQIVEALSASSEAEQVYKTLFAKFIQPAVQLARAGKNDCCQALYEACYLYAKEKANADGLRSNACN